VRIIDLVKRSIGPLALCALAFATIGSAGAKWVVDQAYSNAMDIHSSL
jgi:hypothetical protein